MKSVSREIEMKYSLFSATGCRRCKIVKSYLEEHNIEFSEFDIKADGKEKFNAFYRLNRSSIYRGEEGIEFPLLFEGEQVVQGVGVIVAFLKNKELLGEFVSRSDLSQGWVSGLSIGTGYPSLNNNFIDLILFLKDHGLQTCIETDGRNSHLMNRLIESKLIDKLIFNLYGPAAIYEEVSGSPISEEELSKSLSLLSNCPEYQIILSLSPFWRDGKNKDIIEPDEAARAAAFVEKATGKKTHPFFIKEDISGQEKAALPEFNIFKYRTACRRYMVKSEILKS
jgi:pyruvate formate lyase activating enzyme